MPTADQSASQSASEPRYYEVVTAEKHCPLCAAIPGEPCRVRGEDGSWQSAPPWMKSIHVERGNGKAYSAQSASRIERYECPGEGCPSHTPIFGQGHKPDCEAGARVRVEYVPANEVQSAYDEGFSAGRAQGYQDGVKTAMERL